LGECTVVPDVPVVGEAIAHVTQATLLDVLLDGVERLLLGDFHLCIGPTGNLDDHVEDAVVPIRKQRDVMERRNDLAILLDVDAMFCYTSINVYEDSPMSGDHMVWKADIPRV
jgi:hypothetical protein